MGGRITLLRYHFANWASISIIRCPFSFISHSFSILSGYEYDIHPMTIECPDSVIIEPYITTWN